MRILVAYFSASGITKEVARSIASVAQSMQNAVQTFEITPKVPYSKADLDWTNEQSRTTIECKDKNSCPELSKIADISSFDAIFIGFPVWWYNAPHIIFSFLESADFSGKIIVPFCTSGGSGLESAPKDMQKCAPKAIFRQDDALTLGQTAQAYENGLRV
mgnify:CR=1 FL=1